MSIFRCELCEAIRDCDYEECVEYQGGLICEACQYELAAQLDNQCTQWEPQEDDRESA